MHIHANPLAVQAANFYSSQLEQEVEARRAADLRRRLRKVSDAIAGADATPEEALLISHWTSAEIHPEPAAATLAGDDYRPSGQNGDASPTSS